MIDFIYPWLLTLGLLPLLSTLLLPKVSRTTQSALKVPFFNFLQKRFGNNVLHDAAPNIFARLVAWLIWLLLVLGASGPVWLGKPITFPNEGRSIMIAIDLSGSMDERDMLVNGNYYTRFDIVKAAASHFILERQSDRIGLILFGSKAYLRAPLTPDNKTVAQILENVTPGLAGQKTAIGDAIGLAIKKLQNAPEKNRILILMTDGRSNSGTVLPLKAAQMANNAHIKIYTIGLGSTQAKGIWGIHDGGPDNEVLQKIANETNGKFFFAGSAEQLKTVYEDLDKIESTEQKPEYYRPTFQLYPYPLAIALLLSMLLAIPILLQKFRTKQ
jgi:Ca-activated chloride channel homolog